MGNEKFVIIRKRDGKNISRVDLNKSTEFGNGEWRRYVDSHIPNPEDVTVIFDRDIKEDWGKLHQYKKIDFDGSITDTRPTKHNYKFSKSINISKGNIKLGSKTLKLDDELTDGDIEDMKRDLNMNEVEHTIDKYPSDETLFRIEGK